MPEQEKTKVRLEIAHVLFMDIVGYSKLLMDEQTESIAELNHLVRENDAVQEAEAARKLIRLPTGDGMALVFTDAVESPVECALQISQKLRAQPSLPLRMGIHSGPVQHVADVNERENIAGAGINIAQRVMDCGDAGHILVSKRVADDLAQYRRWQPYLHELGDFEVKHGVVVTLVNLYADVVGNPVAPARFAGIKTRGKKGAADPLPARPGRWLWSAAAAMLFIAGLGFAIYFALVHRHRSGSAAAALTAATPSSSKQTPAPAVSNKSIAVLPFENLSADKDNAFFTDGVQDEILADLAKVADLKVIARSSVIQYKSDAPRNLPEIAAQLGVANVLEGSVQRAGNQVRVTANLINARTAAQLWAEHYDKPLNDVFAIQSEIAEAIAGQLQVRLSPAEKTTIDAAPTADLAAYDLYLRAQQINRISTRSSFRKALPEGVHLLEEALRRDPKFLSAWTLLAHFQGDLYFWYDSSPAQLERYHDAVQAAVRLQPDAAETHLALADFYYHGYLDYTRALAELDLARRTRPNDPEIYAYSGYMERRQGHWTQGLSDLERAMELDPRNTQLLQQVALNYIEVGRYADAAKTYRRMLTITPTDAPTRLDLVCLEIDAKADLKPFEETMAVLLAENPHFFQEQDDAFYAVCERDPATAERYLANVPPEGATIWSVVWPRAYREALVARLEGDAPRARAAFTAARAQADQQVAAHPQLAMATSALGLIDAGLGRKEEAIAEGRHACALLPVSKDALTGQFLAQNLAQILAWTGEKAAAIEQIEAIERLPNQLSYGLLKLDPAWDNLRGDPRFEALVASRAPKE